MVTRVQANLLRRAYYDTTSPVAFGGRTRLIKYARTRGIRPKHVDEWLQNQPAHVLHKNRPLRFRRSKIYAPFQHAIWEADLTYMDKLARWNDGYKYLLVVVDIFSKQAAVQPLKKRTATATALAFRRILRSMRARPRKLRTDRGREFTGQPFQRLMQQRNIDHYTTFDEDIKAGVVERLHRTLKSTIYKYMTASKTKRYVGQLQNLVTSYNNATHRTIGMAPAAVRDIHRARIYERMYGDENDARVRSKLEIGDAVLLARKHTKFTRGHEERWRRAILYVSGVKRHAPFRYMLQTENGQNLPGTYYRAQLQKVNPNVDLRL